MHFRYRAVPVAQKASRCTKSSYLHKKFLPLHKKFLPPLLPRPPTPLLRPPPPPPLLPLALLTVLDEMLRIGEHEKANCLGTTEATEWAIAAQARAVAECAGATLCGRVRASPYRSRRHPRPL